MSPVSSHAPPAQVMYAQKGHAPKPTPAQVPVLPPNSPQLSARSKAKHADLLKTLEAYDDEDRLPRSPKRSSCVVS